MVILIVQSSKMYTTDGKVKWFTSEEDVNEKLITMLGTKFENYHLIMLYIKSNKNFVLYISIPTIN